MGTLLDLVRTLGGFAALAVALLTSIYFLPGSPLRRAVERWVDKRIDHRYDKALEYYRHQLATDADRIRTEYQRRFHNAALVIERKHEVFRELFRLVHVAGGVGSHLFGFREVPSFKDHNQEDIRGVVDALPVTSAVKEGILARWSEDRDGAIEELSRVRRRVEVSTAETLYAEAWNYFLTNSLYLPDSVYDKASRSFTSMREVIADAKLPEGFPLQGVTQHCQDVSDQIEELRVLLRGELGVIEEQSSTPEVDRKAQSRHEVRKEDGSVET